MPVFPPDQLAAWTNGRWSMPPSQLVLGFTVDSRKLAPGQMFVALRTDKRDGHDFIPAAAEAGAAGAIVARADDSVDLPQLVVRDPLAAFQALARLHRLAAGVRVTGVTGSAGKTSTKNLLALLLGEAPAVLATEGNLNNFLGVPLTLTRLEPGATRHAVIEAGINQPDEMGGLARMIQPDGAIVTLVAAAHLEKLGSVEQVAYEKSELLRWLPSGGLAVFPFSAWQYASFQHLVADSCVAVPSGVHLPARMARTHFVPFAVAHHTDSTELTLGGGHAPRVFELRRVSDGMAQNAALALLMASSLGVTDAQLRARLPAWQPANLRGELRTIGDALVYLDCYNANPASMTDALATFQQLTPPARPRSYVLGGMEELGATAAEHHRKLGASLRLRGIDQAWAIGPHAAAVADGLLASGATAAQVHVAATVGEIRAALTGNGGAVFVKGSRRFQLETLFAEEIAPAAAH